MLAGSVRFGFGANGAGNIEAGDGNFFVVPPHLVHRERNPGADDLVVVAIRSGSGLYVVNVEAPTAG